MKLCSQCEFIYEDDQECCDMDGAELIYEPTMQTVSNSQQAEIFTAPPKALGFAASGSFRFLIVAAVVLVAVVFSAYYASRRLMSARAERGTGTSVQSPNAPAAMKGTSGEKAPASDSSTTSDQTPSSDQSPHADASSSSPSNQSPANVGSPSSSLNFESDEIAITAAPASPHNQRSAHAPYRSRSATDSRLTIPKLSQSNTLPRVPPLRRLPPARVEKNSSTVASVNKPDRPGEKKASRLGSFLKKTSRILTKPFRG